MSTTVNRLALIVALLVAGAIVWIGLRDDEPLLIILGPALLAVAAVIRVPEGLRAAGVRRPPPSLARPLPDPSPEVDALILEDKKIAAIKQYRDETGAGLKEAKDAVEARERRIRLPGGSP